MNHLVLTRKPGESIRIDADIFITIERIAGNQVRVSINAPHAMKIIRTELDGIEPPGHRTKATP